jgi:hypothetical protein
MAGVLHATNRPLPVPEPLTADFYLPLARVFIDYWAAEAPPSVLKLNMRKADVYKRLGLSAIEIHSEDIAQLDDVLPRQLHKAGVRFI